MRRTLSAILWALLTALAACGQVATATPSRPTPTVGLEAVRLGTFAPTLTPAANLPAIEPSRTPRPSPTPIIYTIQAGDTLLGIALRYGIELEALQLANPEVRPQFLQIGQEIILPPPETGPAGSNFLALPTPMPLPIMGFGCADTPVGGLWCFGEVINDSGYLLQSVRVEVTLLNSDGGPLAIRDSWTSRDVIPPGESAPFAVFFRNAPAAWRDFRLSLLTTAASGLAAELWHDGLVILEDQGMPAGPSYRVTGTLGNGGDVGAEQISLTVTWYNAQDKIAGFRRVELAEPLAGGAQRSFEVWLSPGGLGVGSYAVSVDGRRVASEAAPD